MRDSERLKLATGAYLWHAEFGNWRKSVRASIHGLIEVLQRRRDVAWWFEPECGEGGEGVWLGVMRVRSSRHTDICFFTG